jgi:hypothetical protein
MIHTNWIQQLQLTRVMFKGDLFNMALTDY